MTPYEVAVARDFPAFRRMDDQFNEKGYRLGKYIEVDRYSWPSDHRFPRERLEVGHYIDGIAYRKIGLSDVPEKFRTKEFFIHTISDDNVRYYIQTHPKKFNQKFFRDLLATDADCLKSYGGDIFEWMPLEYLDEEMVMCAVYASFKSRDNYNWIFLIHKRKPEILTRDIYIIAAKKCGPGRDSAKQLKRITPRKYRNKEFYSALCHEDCTGVMEVVPKRTVTNKFLMDLYLDNPRSIECFTEEALEREVKTEKYGTVKFWQLAVLDNGELMDKIPTFNDERVEFFLTHYDKDSFEYEYHFKRRYKAYLRQKNGTPRRNNDSTKASGLMMLAIAFGGGSINEAVDVGNKIATGSVNREAQLPIKYRGRVPDEYRKKFDKEEYLLEIYKKLGIEVLGEADAYYYDVILPEGITVERDGDYVLKKGDEVLLHYRDVGNFWDRDVDVNEISITL